MCDQIHNCFEELMACNIHNRHSLCGHVPDMEKDMQSARSYFSSIISSKLPTLMGDPRRSSTCGQGMLQRLLSCSASTEDHGNRAGITFVLSSSLRSSRGFSCSWVWTNSSSMRSQSLTRSSFSRRSLHLALGVMFGSLEPKPPAASRRFCFLPIRGGGTGGSHFFFFSCPARDTPVARGLQKGHQQRQPRPARVAGPGPSARPALPGRPGSRLGHSGLAPSRRSPPGRPLGCRPPARAVSEPGPAGGRPEWSRVGRRRAGSLLPLQGGGGDRRWLSARAGPCLHRSGRLPARARDPAPAVASSAVMRGFGLVVEWTHPARTILLQAQHGLEVVITRILRS